MKTYAMLGLPGCIGSIDATFVPWGRVPTSLGNLCAGDKGKGLLYEVIVTHFKEVLSVEGGYNATVNDKISVKYSQFMDDLKNNRLTNGLSYKVKPGVGDDEYIELMSCNVIANNGYLQWFSILCGFGITSNPTTEY